MAGMTEVMSKKRLLRVEGLGNVGERRVIDWFRV